MAKKPRTPKPIGPRIKDEKAYERAIKKEILTPLFKATTDRLKSVPQIKASYVNAVNQEFAFMTSGEAYGVEAVTAALDNIRKVHRAKMIRNFQAALSVDITPFMSDLGIRGLMNQAIFDNVALIKSIPQKLNLQIVSEFEKVFIKKGFDQQAMIQALEKRFKVAGNRAKLIARDQTSKIIGSLNQARQTNLGIKSYIWQTMEDERVRETHEANDGKEFLWSVPPRETGHPGQDINCRCLASPVIPELQNVVDFKNYMAFTDAIIDRFKRAA